jgi:hypothetical protein
MSASGGVKMTFQVDAQLPPVDNGSTELISPNLHSPLESISGSQTTITCSKNEVITP